MIIFFTFLKGSLSTFTARAERKPAVEMRGLVLEVLRHALLRRAAPVRAQLGEGGAPDLHQRGEVLLRVPRNCAALDDADGLLEGLKLLRPELLARREVRGLHLASR